MLRIEARASKRCEDCFNDGVREALSYVIKNIDHELGYLPAAHDDTTEILKRLRLLIQNDIEVWENRKEKRNGQTDGGSNT